MAVEHLTVSQVILSYEVMGDEHAHVAVTEWHNGEGFDVEINQKGCHALFQITHEGWASLKKAMKSILKRHDGVQA